MCSKSQMACIQKLREKINITDCLPPCSGLMLTSYDKNDQNMNLDNLISKELDAYKKITKGHNFPSELKGYVTLFLNTLTTE